MISIKNATKIDALAADIAAEGYLSCEAAEIDGGWILPLDDATRELIDTSIMRLFVRSGNFSL